MGPEGGRVVRRSFFNAERFWEKVKKTDSCWLWTASVNVGGYGQFSSNPTPARPQEPYLSHRVAYALTHGECPAHKVVMHTCDTPACVNPAHLRLGTQLQNMRDARGRGRITPTRKTHCSCGSPRWTSPPKAARNWSICESCYRKHTLALSIIRHNELVQGRIKTNRPIPRQSWAEVVALVGERNATIYARNHGLYGYTKPEKLADIARSLGVSRERCRQVVIRTAQWLDVPPMTFWGGRNKRYVS